VRRILAGHDHAAVSPNPVTDVVRSLQSSLGAAYSIEREFSGGGRGEFALLGRRALFSIEQFTMRKDDFDVLPGEAGFLMLVRRAPRSGAPELVFVDQWPALLVAAKAGR
jgi:hypothetical protein